jgi:hypothetical protein
MKLIAAAVVTGCLSVAGPVGAATVPNMFVRSCYIGCSSYVQSNGAYKSQYPSECITKSWGGQSDYVVGPGHRCP